MSDTLGGLIDKLITVDMKLWNSQDIVYKIRKMDWDTFRERCDNDEVFLHEFYNELHKATDLNLQRNNLITEIDLKLIEIVTSSLEGKELDNGKFIQRPNKLY